MPDRIDSRRLFINTTASSRLGPTLNVKNQS